MQLESLSGLEILRGIISGELPHPTIAKTVPMLFKLAEPGRVVFEATAGDTHINPMGGVHGGFVATVLDSVTGCAVHSMLEAGIPYATIELNIKMTRPVPLNTKLQAEGKIINLSRRLGISEGWIRTPEDKLIAHATCTCMIIRS